MENWEGLIEKVVFNERGFLPAVAQDIPVEHWRTLMSINLDGVFWGCQAAHPHIKARGGGSDKPPWGEAYQAHVNDRMPLQRIGMPEELKGTAIFLASEASCLVTGHILPVDGGWLAW